MKSETIGKAQRLAIGFFAAVLMLSPKVASAVRIDISPAISIDQVYDSNVFNRAANEEGDFLLRTTPEIVLSFRFPETTMNLRSSIVLDRYYEFSELNSDDSAITLALDSQPPIAVTPRLSLTPSAHYVQARNSYQRNQLIPSGDPLAPPSISSDAVLQKSRDYGGGLRMVYLLAQKIDFFIGGAYNKREYLGNTTLDEGSKVVRGDTAGMYKFTPNVSSGLFYTNSFNDFDNGRDSEVHAGGLAGRFLVSPVFTIEARAGVSYMEESFPFGNARYTNTYPHGFLTLVYARQDFKASLNGSVEQTGTGGFGQTTGRETANLTVSDRFAEKWTAELAGTYQANHSLEPGRDDDVTSRFWTGKVVYQVLEWVNLHMAITGFRQDGNGTLGSDLTRYSGFVGFTVGNTFNVY